MVGGTVIETIELYDRVWINVKDDRDLSPNCAIYVEKDDKARCVSEGDAIWWQSGYAMWTPACNQQKKKSAHHHDNCLARCGVDYDIKLKRIGCSGAPRPPSNWLSQPKLPL